MMASNPIFHWLFYFWRARFGLAPLGWRGCGQALCACQTNHIKNAIYECGLVSKGDAWMQFRSAYYLYAIIFLSLMWSRCFCCRSRWRLRVGAAACVAMLVFVLLLIEDWLGLARRADVA